MRRCYFSRVYKSTTEGGYKAKIDFETIMDRIGFVNIGIKQRIDRSSVRGFIFTLLSVLKAALCVRKGDLFVIQYPLKKYFKFIARIARMKGAKVIVIIIDLGAYRRKKLTSEEEKKKLSLAHSIILISEVMKAELVRQGYTQDMQVLGMWDFQTNVEPEDFVYENKAPFEIVYVGGLAEKNNSFFYRMTRENQLENLHVEVLGAQYEHHLVTDSEKMHHNGVLQPEDIIKGRFGDFALVWYGHSYDHVDGVFGEYFRLTVSGKSSLYVHCHLPQIVWSEMAYAPFVKEHNIGICVDSLEHLSDVLDAITPEQYSEMRENTKKVSQMLKDGFFFKRAFTAVEENLMKGNK